MATPLRCCAALLACCWVVEAAAAGALHVASPDWRGQVIYFAMIDRFDDGDPGNNDQGRGEYDPASGAHYSGGDLAGLRRRLDYIQGLGATALWITPPVRHQWWDGSIGYGGYHGYWGEHFAQVDPHFGTLADYRALSQALHARGMYLVQDVVVNHTGNYFSYPRDHDGRDAAQGHARNPSPGAHAAPTQWPFSLNDARDPAQRAADVYHWTPDIADFGDPRQERNWQLSALDDLNTENPVVRRALRASYGHWISEAGVDAFRVDTAFYVPPDYFRDFLHADDAAAPGVLRVAARTGRHGFHVFGEGFAVDPPYQEAQARKIERWARDAHGPLLPAMINFPLYGSLLDVFARGRPSAVLAHRIESMMRVHAAPHLMPSFVDNHDVDRFLAGGSEAGLRQALLAIFTLPGIPTVYYGTEQGYTAPRAALFARGYGSGGRDRFDQQAPLYLYLQRLAALRRMHPELARGTPRVVERNGAAPGVVAWSMQEGARRTLVALNSAPHAVLWSAAPGTLPPGARLQPRFALQGDAPAARADARGGLALVLPPHAGWVWTMSGKEAGALDARAAPTLEALPAAPQRGALALRGRAAAGARLQLVVDGNLDRAATAQADAQGRWRARLAGEDFIDAAIEHRVVAFDAARGLASPAQPFRAAPDWQRRLRYVDPAGDDHGPQARYRYPTASLWRRHRPADLRRIDVDSSGGALRIRVVLNDVVAAWSPPHGFDHVALSLFVELPGRAGGVRAMPGQQASLPDGMRWHYRLRAGGWSNALYAAAGADALHEGTPVTPAATLRADAAGDAIELLLPAAALGHPATLRGARLYLATWDYDGGWRALAPAAGPFVFGGGEPGAPRVMDDSGVLELR